MSKNENKVESKPLAGRGPMSANFEKPKEFKKNAKQLLNELKPIKLQLILVSILAIVGAAFVIITPKVMEKAIKELPNFFSPFLNSDEVLTTVLKFLTTCVVLYVVSTILSVISGFIMAKASQNVCYNLRKKMREKLSRLPLKYYDSNQSGDILTRVVTDTDTVSTNLQTILTQTIVGAFNFLAILGMMFSISWQLTLVALVILPVGVFCILMVMKKGQKSFKKQASGVGKLTAQCDEDYSSLRTIQAYGMENNVISKFDKTNEQLVKDSFTAIIYSGLTFPMINFINNFAYVFLATFGCVLASKHILEIPALLIFIQYSSQFNQQLGQFAQISSQLQTTVAAAERIFEIIDAQEDQDIGTLTNIEFKGNIEFKNIKFGYSDNKILMQNVNFQTKEGEMVAIVGPTGAGKTTIVNLLMGFYNVNSGSILFDNVEHSSIKKSYICQNIGMVLQDVWLFNGTIAENIAFGKNDASMEEVISAAEKAQCHHFIQTLPDGYNTVISEEGGNISVGQRQLLTIARAMLTDPQILILDEATSNVDTRTEVLIQKAMKNALNGRTSFVIAHRLSTIKKADKILYMSNGDILEQGTHDELIESNGLYTDLFKSQFES